jgi:hypothetical protein
MATVDDFKEVDVFVFCLRGRLRGLGVTSGGKADLFVRGCFEGWSVAAAGDVAFRFDPGALSKESETYV